MSQREIDEVQEILLEKRYGMQSNFLTVKDDRKGFRNLRQKNLLPNESQRRGLCQLLHHVLVDIRQYGYEGKCLEASELADIFHNIPNEMYGDGLWDLPALMQRIGIHQRKHGGRNYSSHLESIFRSDPVKFNTSLKNRCGNFGESNNH